MWVCSLCVCVSFIYVCVCVVIAIIVCNWLHLWPRGANINKPIKDQVQRPNHSNNKGNMCRSSTERRAGGTWSTGDADADVDVSVRSHKMAGNENQSKWSQLFYELIARSFIFLPGLIRSSYSPPRPLAITLHTTLRYVCSSWVGSGEVRGMAAGRDARDSAKQKEFATDYAATKLIYPRKSAKRQ